MNEIKSGMVVGDGALLILQLGFIPDYFEVFDGTNGDTVWKWARGMADGTAVKLTSGAVATLATNGISAYDDPDADIPKGVTLGTDVSVAAADLYYMASRSGPGAQGDGLPA